MELQHIKQKYEQHPHSLYLKKYFNEKKQKHFHLKRLTESAIAFFIAATIDLRKVNLVILNNAEEAAYFFNDITNIVPDCKIHYFPASFTSPSNFGNENNANNILRTETLQTLQQHKHKIIIVTYADALLEKVATKQSINKHLISLETSKEYDISQLCRQLVSLHFQQVDFVDTPGQFALRGSILDIFSFNNELPYRIDFFDEEVTSIRTFDIETQLSVETTKQIKIIPDLLENTSPESLTHFISTLPPSTVLWGENMQITTSTIADGFEKIQTLTPEIVLKDAVIPTATILSNETDFLTAIKPLQHTISWGLVPFDTTAEQLSFQTLPQPIFNKNFDLLIETFKEYKNEAINSYIVANNPKQLKRLQTIFEDKQAEISFQGIEKAIHKGFVDMNLRIACFTDHQIFERYHRHKLKSDHYKKAKSGISINELLKLNPGDYITHIDHGVGQFIGLQKINEDGKNQEFIKLIYQNNDILLVNLHSLHKISKFREKDGETPKINKLGTAAWQNLKKKTKSKIKDIAKELIALYAERKAKEGYAYMPDSFLQQELEASFLYEDTPDQEKATVAVKEDMESKTPMDRLICGDVGFGKTEIAIRAAFKAISDSKQVAVLVPTTILAFQHYNTFCKRLEDFPCRVEYISRLRSTKKVREVITDLREGKIDIIIGTHKLVGKSVQFKDLGLLIIDEEQRFGVAVKEKLKSLRVNVDTLTLTATPIPRTLQFSLMGARDLSIINTPPPNRHPITTEIHGFNDTVIRESIMYELNRGGQVFFIHNRVQNIYELQEYLKRIIPEASSVVGHGQMEGAKLEKVLLDFIDGNYDILIATTIIESGLDIPNVNTIIINQAHQFGLSELHQLRGRVGRSNTKAFCYLLAPAVNTLPSNAKRRLQALENFSDLGSGFQLAMQDLDIRGAGNLLGGEQSGFISDMGYETYQRILDEAISELQTTEFKELFTEQKQTNKNFISDCQIDTDMEVLIPDTYIENTSEKLKLYRELDNVKTEKEIFLFEQNLKDRFGAPPQQTLALMDIVRIRLVALSLNFERIILKKEMLFIHLISDNASLYYESALFGKILEVIREQIVPCTIKETPQKKQIKITHVKTVRKALEQLNKIAAFCNS